MVSLVSRTAPDFTAPAVSSTGEIFSFSLSESTKGKYRVLFFYPLDFTFVCPSELLALENRIEQFKAKNTEVIAISIDSEHTHSAWRNTPVNQGGIGPVSFTMVSDKKHEICRAYGIEQADKGVALRGAFLLDKDMTMQSQIVNNLPIGRNIDEILRTVDALQFHEQHGEVCPAGWQSGDQTMSESRDSVASFLAENAENL